uniref:TSA: Wollemia nobilis Ref_Wollemi_Transcript_408_629 transcribed RNA sequence n=1 Tax=Wollemia nobilis TaxID=56998 RepID=A0A0C9RR22_9CONI
MNNLDHVMDDGHLIATLNQFFHFPEELEKMVSSSARSYREEDKGAAASAAVDVKETPKEYVFYTDVPGLTKSDIQVHVEDGKVLVMKFQGKRKREGEEEEECKYLRIERKTNRKFVRKFTLPGDADVDKISASCADGVLTVTVPRIPPVKKSKTIEISVA